MKKPDTLQGSLDLLVLKILSRRPGLHGYAIMTAIKDASGEVLSAEEGSLYPALHRMEEAGWIDSEWVTKENGRRAHLSRDRRQHESAGHRRNALARGELGDQPGAARSLRRGVQCRFGHVSRMPFARTA